jgi:ADP-ribosylation factor 2-binding protein
MADSEPTAAPDTTADAGQERFNRAIGALEDAVMDEGFRERLHTFCTDNCDSFDMPTSGAGDEYKLEWTPLFEVYTEMLESHIAESLAEAIEGFTMDWFLEALAARADTGEVDGEIFDLLLSLGDFEEFISLMRSHNQEKMASAAGEAGAGEFSATATAGLAPLVSSIAVGTDGPPMGGASTATAPDS